ncbi:MAG: sodium:proton antiporter [Rhizobiaceae bacterium]|nr:sodium:proton antiporter [Rhizobiaceae bacterium]
MHSSFSFFEIASLLLTLSALFGWLNLRFLKLPHTIGLLVMALAGSLLLLALHKLAPGLGITADLQRAVAQIDFYDAIMNGMLAFLLFAGALHVDWHKLKRERVPIVLMATLGVVISTVVVGVLLWLTAGALGFDLPLQWALVFGALISPTDPVAVLGLLKAVDVPESIKAKIAGESLFNDGVAVVAFSVLLAVAVGTAGEGPDHLDPWHIAELFFYEGVGGAIFGFVTGWIAFRLMATIDDHIVEILISLGACAATYALSLRFHISGPIAVVVTGLLIANRDVDYAMSEKVKDYLFAFWEVVDEMLNSVLFLLIGLEVLVIAFDPSLSWIVLLCIPIVLLGRLISVSVPILLLTLRRTFSHGSIRILTWGGLRGGVSVALALSLPDSDAKPLLLSATYAVVIFSIVVQGLTVTNVVSRVVRPAKPPARDKAAAPPAG